MKINPVTQIDWYKADHKNQYPKGTSLVYSNFTPRSSRIFKDQWPAFDGKTLFVGLQGFVKEFLIEQFNEGFFSQPEDTVMLAYKHRCDTSLGQGAVDVEHIRALHKLGYLPIRVKALPEGSLVNEKIPVLTIVNTLPEFFWLTNYLETVLSSALWKPSTNATIAFQYYKMLKQFAIKTGAAVEFVPVQGHEFASRGYGSYLEAGPSGFGHLCSFIGTDTVPAIDFAENYYNADSTKEPTGVSVPATEHSVMCMGGTEGELDLFKRLITEVYPSGIVSIVSDTWDYWKVITEFLPALKEEILARPANAIGLSCVTIRPDSGDPVEIICGKSIKDYSSICRDEEDLFATLKDEVDSLCQADCGQGETGDYSPVELVKFNGQVYQITFSVEYIGHWQDRGDKLYAVDDVKVVDVVKRATTPEEKGSIECMWEIFGGTLSETGYKLLDSHIKLIFGDSITLKRAEEILTRLEEKGFASTSVIFGIGSFTYQYNTRDSLGFAAKATYGEVVLSDGTTDCRNLQKDPKTDNGTKKSACGLMRVEKDGDDYLLFDKQTWEQEAQGELQTIFEDGKLVKETSLAEIRNKLWGVA